MGAGRAVQNGMRRVEGGVLVVDDDPIIRTIVRDALEDDGCEVREAANGAEALAILDKETPDVVVLDMRMPVMDGWEFARRYRARPGPHAPIVCVSAAANTNAWAEEISADGVVPKPFELRELVSVLSRFTRCVDDS